MNIFALPGMEKSTGTIANINSIQPETSKRKLLYLRYRAMIELVLASIEIPLVANKHVFVTQLS